MADLSSITAVRPTASTVTRLVQYGGTVSAGQPVYQSSGTYIAADANASATAAAAAGIAITPGVASGYGLIAVSGSIILVGTTMTVGESYIVSRNAGGICPNGDKTTGDYITKLGTAATTTQLDLSILATGIQVP